jgi:hypothetical protein
VPLRVVDGDVDTRLVEAAEASEVVALVIGARAIPTDPQPLGPTATVVATTVAKPAGSMMCRSVIWPSRRSRAASTQASQVPSVSQTRIFTAASL